MVSGRLEHYGAGADLVAGDIALSSGWGTSPTLVISGDANSQAGTLTVTAKATTAANPTVTITFKEPFADNPVAFATKAGQADSVLTTPWVATATKTTLILKYVGTPTANDVCTVSYLVVG